MFNKDKPSNTNKPAAPKKATDSNVVSTVVGESTMIHGKMQFSGNLLIEGRVNGDISSAGDDAVLILEETGHIEGEVTVQNIIVNGTVKGDFRVANQAELSSNAVVHGDVYYDKLEMMNGARINGSLVHQSAGRKPVSKGAASEAKKAPTNIDTAAVKNG